METLTTGTDLSGALRRTPELTAMTIVWSREGPEHVGESLLPGLVDGPAVFGRALDEDDPSGSLPRLSLVRQRPGENLETAPLRSRKISREQLEITARADGILVVENRGRRDLLVNGRAVKRQRQVREGDVVELRGVLMFLVNRRPRLFPGGRLPAALWPEFGQADACGIIGESPAIWQLRARIAFVAEHDVHTLVSGPSGTGKELVARAIHALSARTEAPLVARNAATFPEGLIDSELFGNVADYPNPGMPARPGLIGAADGSILFLDEIGELPHALQAHLLRVLDEGEYQRLGEAQTRRANLRLIAATNRPTHELKHDVAARMRMHLEVPGLEARREDIGLLIPALLRQAAHEGSTALAGLFPDADPTGHPRIDPKLVRAALVQDYETHLRELARMLWQAMMSSATAGLDHVALDEAKATVAGATEVAPAEVDPASLTREQIVAALERAGGVKDKAWPLLGLRNRYQLYRMLEKFDIQ